jgi:hypothetical protein
MRVADGVTAYDGDDAVELRVPVAFVVLPLEVP